MQQSVLTRLFSLLNKIRKKWFVEKLKKYCEMLINCFSLDLIRLCLWWENVLWGHISAQRLALEGMDHFPTLEIESESNCVLPWLITGWEDRPSQQHNSIWAKYLYRGGTTSLTHNTFIHIRESYFQCSVREICSVCQGNITASCRHLLRQVFGERVLY